LGRQKLTGPRGETIISPPPGNLGRQRESTSGPAGGGERGTDDDCTADDCVLGCGGLCCGIGAACWDVDGGGDDIFCLMSSSTVCSVAMFWAICSCLAASCSTLRRTVSRFNAKGSSCCTGSVAATAVSGDKQAEITIPNATAARGESHAIRLPVRSCRSDLAFLESRGRRVA
jgi:hypothetical protein